MHKIFSCRINSIFNKLIHVYEFKTYLCSKNYYCIELIHLEIKDKFKNK